MDITNAIAKVRFSSARPQRVHLNRDDELSAELLCIEPGQQFNIDSGQWVYYVITGAGTISADGTTTSLETGHTAASRFDEAHSLINSSEQRLICLAVGRPQKTG